MKQYKDISLKPYNTFGIDHKAHLLIETSFEDEVIEAISTYPSLKVLGGGSNILLTKDIETPLLRMTCKGVTIEQENEDYILIKAQAGENWSEFVDTCVAQGYGGVENLSLIYGSVGAAPVQNIGAYWVEFKDVFHSCEAFDRQTKEKVTFYKADCLFGYRDSIFKQSKGRYVILSVTFQLTKKNHSFKTDYGNIQKILSENYWEETPEHIATIIKHIRRSKLPDPNELGNSGSFFKNPIVSRDCFLSLQKRYPHLPHYWVSNTQEKIPAAFLIESCDLKGLRMVKVGVHTQQPLVLVNYGEALGNDILSLAHYIQEQVEKHFQIPLEMEVNVW